MVGVYADVFRTDTQRNGLLSVKILAVCLGEETVRGVDFDTGVCKVYKYAVAVVQFKRAFEEVHLRRSDEACHKLVAGEAVQVARRVDLLYVAVLHYYDTSTHGHCFNLVVGNVNEGCLQLVV